MEYAKAKAHIKKKMFGKCVNCIYACLPKTIGARLFFCDIREQNMNNDLLMDYFTIKFCKYYEEDKS